MKIALFFAFLLIASSYCVTLKSLAKSNSKIASQLKELQTTKLGKMLYTLVEVHMETNGPLDELFQEIANLQDSIAESIAQENANYDGIVADHEAEVQIDESQIAQANSDISTHTSTLQILQDQLASLQQASEDLSSQIEDTNSQIVSGQAQRDADAAVFAQFEADSNDAIDALNEALNFMNQLVNAAPTMIQMRQAKQTMSALSSKKLLKNNVYTPLIKALIALSQNFSDQETVQKIINLLQNVLQSVEDNLATAQANEASAVAAWGDQLQNLQNFLAELTVELTNTQNQIETTQDNISGEEAALAAAQEQLALWTAALDAENAKFDNLTAIHESVIAELTDEQNTVDQAAAILDDARTQLSDYVQGVMNA